ncbi:uncharacterized protein JN550_013080 [Neoarthrinium moseri]|uniref:uncharacterized protein n=1 Tax=Neoarthrinium moseri TaxID=1658444 RepID=UPI001FDC5A98|nr:uncharacterized protein JN550_013080 [Neoarthrinium moseri]KAI1857744.1 hypothetical protein JN550_013080 [Neoarthrinium moseri]
MDKSRFLRFSSVLPLRTKGLYHQVPSHDLSAQATPYSDATPFGSPILTPVTRRTPKPRWSKNFRRFSVRRIVTVCVAIALLATLVLGGYRRRQRRLEEEAARDRERPKHHWEFYETLDGFYNGVRSLVKLSDWTPEQSQQRSELNTTVHHDVPMEPVLVDPYHFGSEKFLEDNYPVSPCFIDEDEKIPAPDVFAYPGIPANMPAPHFGSYNNLGITPDMCWERFGRLGPYGYSYPKEEGGLGFSVNSERAGADKILAKFDKIDWRNMNWDRAQKRCFEKNKHRFGGGGGGASPSSDEPPKKKVPRTAFVLRTWTGYEYDDIHLLSLRAMINELALKSGGEYDIHLLVHVKDESIPIWASEEVYQDTLRKNVPAEFWGMATLWSVPLMRLYYPGPFLKEDNYQNMAGSDIYGVYRSAHFALQWFSQQHPEYDFFWNWEMDVRFTGHHYEFHNQVAQWADMQPRKLLWERSQRVWIPDLHGSWENFSQLVEKETLAGKEAPIWGPVDFPTASHGMLPHPNGTKPPRSFEDDNYEWGVGEPADLIVFDPFVDPDKSAWVFRLDVTGYNTTLAPPPRRYAIITIGRLSKRLLNVMHDETYKMRHTMFPEMFPASVALHHGLKAVYAPHPVHFDRRWPLDVLDRTYNHVETPNDSPFGGQEHNNQGGSFYYNSGFSGAMWRRWLGAVDNNEGGRQFEEKNSGRMCLRGLLYHPIKFERVD